MTGMDDLVSIVSESVKINPWGMLGCALAYAGAVFAAVDAIGEHLLGSARGTDARALHGLRLKTGSKIVAAIIAVAFAGVVLSIDGNWIALAALTAASVGIVVWVSIVYTRASRGSQQPERTPG